MRKKVFLFLSILITLSNAEKSSVADLNTYFTNGKIFNPFISKSDLEDKIEEYFPDLSLPGKTQIV